MLSETEEFEHAWRHIADSAVTRLEKQIEETMSGSTSPPQLADFAPTTVFTKAEYAGYYTQVYNLCARGSSYANSERLYRRFGESISLYIQQLVLPSLMRLDGQELLVELTKRWVAQVFYMDWMGRLLVYLDRDYLKTHAKESVRSKGYNIFRDLVFEPYKTKCADTIMALVASERDESSAPRLWSVVKVYCDMLVSLSACSEPGGALLGRDDPLLSRAGDLSENPAFALGIYAVCFEDKFLLESSAFYPQWAAARFSLRPDFVGYMKAVSSVLSLEERRVAECMHASTWPKLKHIIVTELLQEVLPAVLELPAGPKVLLEGGQFEELSLAYSLLSLIPSGKAPLVGMLKASITAAGASLVAQLRSKRTTDSASQVLQFVELHERYRAVLSKCFEDDPLLLKGLREAFESFVNEDLGDNSLGVCIARFVDAVIRKPGKYVVDTSKHAVLASDPSSDISMSMDIEGSKPIDDTQTVLTKGIEIFGYVNSKDEFLREYRELMQARLLFPEMHANQAHERFVVDILKSKCGNQFAAKLDGMLGDVSASAKMSREFDEIRERMGGTLVEADFSVNVLTSSHWLLTQQAAQQQMTMTIPPPLGDLIVAFENHYQTLTNYRKLTWVHPSSTVCLSATYLDKSTKYGSTYKRFELVMKLPQALVLLAMSDEVSPSSTEVRLTVRQLTRATGLPSETVVQVVKSLSGHKCKLLDVYGSANIEDTVIVCLDVFNSATKKHRLPDPKTFSSKGLQERVSDIDGSASSDATEHEEGVFNESARKERIEEDRGYAIEAAIVRILKHAKRMAVSDLVKQVVGHLKIFKPTPASVDARVDQLIQRDFIARDPGDAAFLQYVA